LPRLSFGMPEMRDHLAQGVWRHFKRPWFREIFFGGVTLFAVNSRLNSQKGIKALGNG
jgi:hypothetical protein